MNILNKLAVVFLFSAFFLANPALATMLIEDYPLDKVEQTGLVAVDPAFQGWIDRYANQDSVADMTSVEIDKALAKVDPISRSFAHALREQKLKKKKDYQVRLKALVKDVEGYNAKQKQIHPLTSYIYGHVLQASSVEKKNADEELAREKIITFLAKETPRSCPRKDYVQSQLSNVQLLTNDTAKVSQFLLEAQQFQSYKSRNDILQPLLANLPKKSRKKVIDELWPLAAKFSSHVARNKWMAELVPQSDEPDTIFAAVLHETKRRRCDSAKKAFSKVLKNKSEEITLTSASSIAKKVGNCFKRRGVKRRIQAWQKMTPMLAKRFGFDGWAEGQIAVARYEWTREDFDLAKKILAGVIERAEKERNDKYLAGADYVLAQIFEDEGEEAKAIAIYEEFSTRFPKDQRANKVLSKLLLAYAGQKDWKKVLVPANRIIVTQNDLAVDHREVSVLGFALFWQGRAFLELNNNEFAEASFKRLVKEFYSTYYGAVGHYLLEQMTEVNWALKPTPSTGFRIDQWYQSFAKDDQLRLARIEGLLKLGLKDEARCEISELTIGDQTEKKLVKALVLHASGRWLSAIKTYSNLSRTFRHTLPYGMEKILFPRKFESDINDYANRLGVDPDFVFALIRQESVFNPNARSSAGAKGLMQLMPQTASLEARKIKQPYVTKKKRRDLLKQTRRSNNLFDANTNLILGTHHLHRLLANYDSPVFSLSAYNAGPTVAARWQKKMDDTDLLQFIERIPYRETRGYVKLILRNYFYYSRWYGDKNKPLPHLRQVLESMLASVENKEAQNIFH